jgi:hypothetical protein
MDSRSQLKNVLSFARLNWEFGKAYRSDHEPRTKRCQRVPEEGIRLSLAVSRLDEMDLETPHAMVRELSSLSLWCSLWMRCDFEVSPSLNSWGSEFRDFPMIFVTLKSYPRRVLEEETTGFI